MKIRRNFVANSSSSAYVLMGTKFDSVSDVEPYVNDLDDCRVLDSVWMNLTIIEQEDFIDDLVERPELIDKLFRPFIDKVGEEDEEDKELATKNFCSGFLNTVYIMLTTIDVHGQLELIDAYEKKRRFSELFTPCLTFLMDTYYPDWKNWHYVHYDDDDDYELEAGYWANREKVIRLSYH